MGSLQMKPPVYANASRPSNARQPLETPSLCFPSSRARVWTRPRSEMAVSLHPTLLYADAEKTLAPKFRAFEEMGFTALDLQEILKGKYSLFHCSLQRKLIPNIFLLQECGIHGQRLVNLLRRSPHVVRRRTSSLKKNIDGVRELGIPPGSLAFEVGLHIANSLSGDTVEEKLAYFKSLGWTEEDTLTVTRRNPVILVVSERKVDEKRAYFKSLGWTEQDTLRAIRRNPFTFGLSVRKMDENLALFKSLGWTEEETMSAIRCKSNILGLSGRKLEDSINFFIQEAGCSASFLAANPVLLTYSMEKRVKPRDNVCRIIKLKHLPEGDWSLTSLLSVAERKFLDNVIHKYMDRLPELKEAYGARS